MAMSPEQKAENKRYNQVRSSLHAARKRAFSEAEAEALNTPAMRHAKAQREVAIQCRDNLVDLRQAELKIIEDKIASLQAEMKLVEAKYSELFVQARGVTNAAIEVFHAAEDAAKAEVLMVFPEFVDRNNLFSAAAWGNTDYAKAAIEEELAKAG